MATQHVDDGDAVLYLADNRVVFISNAEVQSQIGTDLKLVLPITHPEGPPHAADAQRPVDPDRVDDVVQVIVEAVVRNRGVVDRIAGIVQADAADIFAQLEGVPSANDREVIDDREGGSDFDIERVGAEVTKIGDSDNGGHLANGGMVESRAVHTRLDFVDDRGREGVHHLHGKI